MIAGTAFDADVLIYAADDRDALGRQVAALLERESEAGRAIGSVLLLTEVLAKPMRADPGSAEVDALLSVLSRLELRALDEATAGIALAMAVTYGLRAADAAHLATAISAGAETRFTIFSSSANRAVSISNEHDHPLREVERGRWACIRPGRVSVRHRLICRPRLSRSA